MGWRSNPETGSYPSPAATSRARSTSVFAKQQIEVALPAVPRIVDEMRTMAEALQDRKLQTLGFERGSDLLESDFGSPPALRIVGQVSIDAAPAPSAADVRGTSVRAAASVARGPKTPAPSSILRRQLRQDRLFQATKIEAPRALLAHKPGCVR